MHSVFLPLDLAVELERIERRQAELAQLLEKPIAWHLPVDVEADRRSRPERWRDAVHMLAALLDDYEAWRDRLPPSLAEGVTAERIDELLELRDLVEQLEAAELPRGFGRD